MPAKRDFKLFFALFSVALFWGTTFLAIRIGVETVPPLLVTGLRNVIAGFIFLTYLVYSKKLEKMDWPRLRRNMIIALMMIVLANGLTTFAEKYISSGLAALISTLSPLTVLLINLSLGNEKPSLKIFTGIFLGISGMYLIYQNNINDLFNPEYRLGIGAILFAVFTWATGTVYTKRSAAHPGNIVVNLCVQMLFAGILMVVFQLFLDPVGAWQNWSQRSFLAVIYLAIFGSVIGYASYTYALSRLPSTRVSVITYINVVVALFLGWLILGEHITLRIVIAAALIIGGVIVANLRRKELVKSEKDPVPEVIE
ncbi:EamA family transporter [Flavihumibacter sp. R14]|nr:EamA family transporter [Flavihumibacter soli]